MELVRALEDHDWSDPDTHDDRVLAQVADGVAFDLPLFAVAGELAFDEAFVWLKSIPKALYKRKNE